MMRCPRCAAEHHMTLLAWQPYYDEQGVYHDEDPNTVTTQYSCSHGHAWTVTAFQAHQTRAQGAEW